MLRAVPNVQRLVEIKQQMLSLTKEIRKILEGTCEEHRVDEYLLDIRCALDGQHTYRKNSYTLQHSINSLRTVHNIR